MCDEHTAKDNARLLGDTGLSRRRFTTLGAALATAFAMPRGAWAADLAEAEVDVTTPDGVADCYFVHPATGRHAAVILWPDILGLRAAYRTMGKRLAAEGYAVLVVNPYYRTTKAPAFEAGASFQDDAVRTKAFGLMQTLTADTNTTDAKAFAAFLDAQAAVDTSRRMGTMGYCMGGPITMRTAAALPDRIGAGASFHGAALVTDKPDSPHLLVPSMHAGFLIAIAANDDERQPEAKDVLRKAYDEAGVAAEIEVYEGAMHGWCTIDSPVYHEAQAERAWGRMLALFKQQLA
ncbi:MAG: dienelactone hydrolase family protein [Pseudomonadales bacterium]|nr:dienelactone hydrolase family protein [Pseudomonadales bacterium]